VRPAFILARIFAGDVEPVLVVEQYRNTELATYQLHTGSAAAVFAAVFTAYRHLGKGNRS
jgi:hypothetical protein